MVSPHPDSLVKITTKYRFVNQDLRAALQIEIRPVCCVPFAVLIAAHAELLGAGLHAATHHQPVSRLKDVQWAGNSRVGHGADEYRDVLSETKRKQKKEDVRGRIARISSN